MSSDAMLSLFLVGEGESVSRPPEVAGPVVPREINSYYLEDPDRSLGVLVVYEHDFIFNGVPEDLEVIIVSCLCNAMDGGAQVAWFAFEGTFHFEHLLTRDIAGGVYAVADGEAVVLGLDDAVRASRSWALNVEAMGARLLA